MILSPIKERIKISFQGQKFSKLFYSKKNQTCHISTPKMFDGFSRISGKMKVKNQLAQYNF